MIPNTPAETPKARISGLLIPATTNSTAPVISVSPATIPMVNTGHFIHSLSIYIYTVSKEQDLRNMHAQKMNAVIKILGMVVTSAAAKISSFSGAILWKAQPTPMAMAQHTAEMTARIIEQLPKNV